MKPLFFNARRGRNWLHRKILGAMELGANLYTSSSLQLITFRDGSQRRVVFEEIIS